MHLKLPKAGLSLFETASVMGSVLSLLGTIRFLRVLLPLYDTKILSGIMTFVSSECSFNKYLCLFIIFPTGGRAGLKSHTRGKFRVFLEAEVLLVL